MVHPDDREKTRAWYWTQLNGESDELLTIRVPHQHEGWRWVECNGRCFDVNGGRGPRSWAVP
jgi:hypothetical protein